MKSNAIVSKTFFRSSIFLPCKVEKTSGNVNRRFISLLICFLQAHASKCLHGILAGAIRGLLLIVHVMPHRTASILCTANNFQYRYLQFVPYLIYRNTHHIQTFGKVIGGTFLDAKLFCVITWSSPNSLPF